MRRGGAAAVRVATNEMKGKTIVVILSRFRRAATSSALFGLKWRRLSALRAESHLGFFLRRYLQPLSQQNNTLAK